MADAEKKTHLGDLRLLQPLPLTHFVNEKPSSSRKRQQQPDLQTYPNHRFQLFADTIIFKYEDLTSKIAEKRPSRATAKGKQIRKGRISDDERANSEPPSES